MRSRILLVATAAALLIMPATASAYFVHVVGAGETLSSVAAADGLTVSALAAANGLSPAGELVAGQALQIPPQGASAPAPAESAPASGEASDAAPAPVAAGAPAGSYVVQRGDTLSAIAAAHGLSVGALAAFNGLDPNALLISGTSLHFGGAEGTTPAATPVSTEAPAQAPAAGGGAQPTAESVSASEIGSIAAANGVSPSLAEAIAWQESGFNNGLISATGATGVMQIEPGTWDYIGRNLATPPPLSPASAADNIRGGVLLLHALLDATGGDPALTAAGYYQGLASVRAHGMYSDTQRYVNDVMALRARFGGG